MWESEITHILNTDEKELLVKYLGVPLSTDYIHAFHCSSPIQWISTKLEGWDIIFLTIAGHAELIHSTITLIVMYWLLIYQLPVSVIQKN